MPKISEAQGPSNADEPADDGARVDVQPQLAQPQEDPSLGGQFHAERNAGGPATEETTEDAKPAPRTTSKRKS